MSKIFAYHRRHGTITIANGESTSSTGGWRTDSGLSQPATDGILDISEAAWGALQTPAAFTGTSITFTAAVTRSGTYAPVYDENGNALSITVSTSRFTVLPPKLFAAGPYIKIVSGSAEGAARTLNFVLGT